MLTCRYTASLLFLERSFGYMCVLTKENNNQTRQDNGGLKNLQTSFDLLHLDKHEVIEGQHISIYSTPSSPLGVEDSTIGHRCSILAGQGDTAGTVAVACIYCTLMIVILELGAPKDT